MRENFIAAELGPHFQGEDLFPQCQKLEGEVFREVAGRRTIKTNMGGRFYFAKIHSGIGWSEIAKNLFHGRLPVLGARNEYLALKKLAAVGVPAMTGVLFCESGLNPATRRSAIITRALDDTISLEDYRPATVGEKRLLINEIAQMARKMHDAGVNHRDFYLCHFLMDTGMSDDPKLHLIDLHRAQLRSRVPERWLAKDLGGLLFSAFDKGLTRRDLLRFIRVYRPEGLRASLRREGWFWRRVVRRARRLYLQDHDQLPNDIAALLGPP